MSSPDNLTFARILAAIDSTLARGERAAALAGGSLVVAAMAFTMIEVLGRRLFNSPLPGLIDLFDLGMAGMSLLGVAYCQQINGHIRMEVLIGRLTGRPRWIAELLTTMATFVFVALIAESSAEHAVKAWRVGDVTNEILWPLWPSKAIAAAALTALAVRLAVNVAGYARLALYPSAPPIAIPQSAATAL